MVEQTFNPSTENLMLAEVQEHLPDLPMSPAVGVGALALNFALKFCEMNTVKEGAMYQQLKLDNVTIRPGWHIEEVMHIARQFELQIMSAPSRLTEVLIEHFAEACLESLKEENQTETETELG